MRFKSKYSMKHKKSAHRWVKESSASANTRPLSPLYLLRSTKQENRNNSSSPAESEEKAGKRVQVGYERLDSSTSSSASPMSPGGESNDTGAIDDRLDCRIEQAKRKISGPTPRDHPEHVFPDSRSNAQGIIFDKQYVGLKSGNPQPEEAAGERRMLHTNKAACLEEEYRENISSRNGDTVDAEEREVPRDVVINPSRSSVDDGARLSEVDSEDYELRKSELKLEDIWSSRDAPTDSGAFDFALSLSSSASTGVISTSDRSDINLNSVSSESSEGLPTRIESLGFTDVDSCTSTPRSAERTSFESKSYLGDEKYSNSGRASPLDGSQSEADNREAIEDKSTLVEAIESQQRVRDSKSEQELIDPSTMTVVDSCIEDDVGGNLNVSADHSHQGSSILQGEDIEDEQKQVTDSLNSRIINEELRNGTLSLSGEAQSQSNKASSEGNEQLSKNKKHVADIGSMPESSSMRPEESAALPSASRQEKAQAVTSVASANRYVDQVKRRIKTIRRGRTPSNSSEVSGTSVASRNEMGFAEKPKQHAQPCRKIEEGEGNFDGFLSSLQEYDKAEMSIEEDMPTWRSPDAEKLSDVTIEVDHGADAKHVDVYKLHKHVIAIGPRRSKMVYDHFISDDVNINEYRIHLVVPAEAAKHIPMVLDFQYQLKFQLNLSTENCVAVRFIARKLEIKEIMKQTRLFIESDVRLENMKHYLTDAAVYDDDHVTGVIAERCAAKISAIEPTDQLWQCMGPDTFLRTLSSPRINRPSLTRLLSRLLVEYHAIHAKKIDGDMFLKLTREELLPAIDRKASLPILDIVRSFGVNDQFSSLQKRCMVELALNWKETDELTRRRLFSYLRALPSSFTVDFLELVETGKCASLDRAVYLNKTKDELKLRKMAEGSSITKAPSRHKDEVEDDEGLPFLSWRMPPRESFSDWKLVVKTMAYGEPMIYHVHRHILAVGQRKSSLFQILVDDTTPKSRGNVAHSPATGTTVLQMPYTSAVLIPKVLDFVYDRTGGFPIVTETAVGLRFVARVFEIDLLCNQILNFIQLDMDLSTVPIYSQNAATYHDAHVMRLATSVCAKNVEKIQPDSGLIKEISPEFFHGVLSSTLLNRAATSPHLSKLVAAFFENQDTNALFAFASATDAFHLPHIDSSASLPLLRLVQRMGLGTTEAGRDLQRRCLATITAHWGYFRGSCREEVMEELRHVDSSLVINVFDKVEEDYYDREYKSMTLQSKLVKKYRSQIMESEERREREVAEIRNTLEGRVSVLTQKYEQAERQLRQHQNSMTWRSVRSGTTINRRPKGPTANATPERKQSETAPNALSKSKSQSSPSFFESMFGTKTFG